MKKTTRIADVTIRLRLVQVDEDFTDGEPPTLSGVAVAADVGGDRPGVCRCLPQQAAFPWKVAK